MDRKKTYYLIGTLVILVALWGGWQLTKPTPTAQNIEKKLSQINQDPSHYVDTNQPTISISSAQQAQLQQTFLTLYFFSWNEQLYSTAIIDKILAETNQEQQRYLQDKSWQYTGQIFPINTIKNLISNTDLTNFPNFNRRAIVVNTTQVRTFPTLLPAYGNPKQAGQGYPFDDWINSYIFPGTPVRILHRSRDHLWYLIQTASYYGWTPSTDIGLVSADFIAEWTKHPFVTAKRDDVPLYSRDLVLSTLRKGVLYPMTQNQDQQSRILMAIMDADGNAQIFPFSTAQDDVQVFPQMPTPQNVAAMSKTYIGGQYGWGGLYQLRDCSMTTSDLLASFGLWLPRNSLQQANMGKIIVLAGNRRQKLKTIAHQAVPFFTLIHFPGHIALYLGMYHGQAYILQDVWGLKTRNLLGQKGRSVVGKTVITPLEFGKDFRGVEKLQVDSADSFSILDPETYTNIKLIQDKIWHVETHADEVMPT